MESLAAKPPPSPWDTRIPKSPVKNARCIPYNDQEPTASSFINSVSSLTAPAITWNVEDVTKASSLLIQPPMDVEFVNEHEMRKVYSLIYDVFRCEYRFNSMGDRTYGGCLTLKTFVMIELTLILIDYQ